MTTSKFRIKMGVIEVEYEGSDEFLKKELPELLAAVSRLHQEHGSSSAAEADSPPPKRSASKTSKGTTASIAAKLGCKSGGDLLIAAAAQLTFVEGKETFDRKELTAACRAGKNYFKSTYVNNLTTYLAKLVSSGQLNEVSEDEYALSAPEMKSLEAKLASD